MPEAWSVSIYVDDEKVRDRGIVVGEFGGLSVTGTGATPELARADARRRIGAWLEAIELLEEAERE